jgi:large subunit ribosomal protein L15
MTEQSKDILDLSQLKPAAGSVRKNTRRGRGTSAGKGRTCGRGHKGQKSRSGYRSRPGFEGGQMPIQRRLPKRGFSNYPFRKIYQTVNLKRLVEVFDKAGEITLDMLFEKGLVKKSRLPVKLLGDGDVNVALKIHVHAASRSAVEKIQAAGGEVHLIC